MTKIICRTIDCIHWEDGHCSTNKIIYDPEEGCLTYTLLEDVIDEGDWVDDDLVDELATETNLFEDVDDELDDLDDDEW